MVCGRYIISENIVYQSGGFLRYSVSGVWDMVSDWLMVWIMWLADLDVA